MPIVINGATGISGIAFDTVNVSANLTVTNTLSTANVSARPYSYFSNGFSLITFNAGANVAAYTTWTPNPANGNYQYANSNGAFTLAAPATDCAIDILVTNDSNAGTITMSGFTAPSGGGGDTYATTSTYKFILMIRRISSIATYAWKALQ